jgi:hypothetical protein
MDTRVISTPGISFQKKFFPSPMISLSILDELKELGFGATGKNSRDSWG